MRERRTERTRPDKADPARPRALVIEDNPLTLWAIQQTLSPTFDLTCCSTLKGARAELSDPGVGVVICGSPVADEHPEWIGRIARLPGKRVVALMSRSVASLPKSVVVLEKPFQLAELLAEASQPHTAPGEPAAPPPSEPAERDAAAR
jgi:hypothetical protein